MLCECDREEAVVAAAAAEAEAVVVVVVRGLLGWGCKPHSGLIFISSQDTMDAKRKHQSRRRPPCFLSSKLK